MTPPWVIIGCGYTGNRLVRLLRDKEVPVWATRQSEAPLDDLRARFAGLKTAVFDVASDIRPTLPWKGATVVYSAPPNESGAAIERRFAELMREEDVARLIYLSSTGVYGPADGKWVDENAATEAPASEHGKKRFKAEKAFLSLEGLEAVALRATGIYGPGRGMHTRLAAGTYKVLGPGDTYVNRIHVEDFASAILAVGEAKSLRKKVYNVSDGNPRKTREQADELAKFLKVKPPESLPLEAASAMARAFLLGNRKISAQALREDLGWAPLYPTLLEGVAQALSEQSAR